MMEKIIGLLVIILLSSLTSAQQPDTTDNALFFKSCIQIDPTFPYYQNRSWNSVAEEVVANGFEQVAITGTSPDVIIPEFVNALKAKGLSVRCLYGPLNAYYTSCKKWLPSGWEKWRVKYAGDDPFKDIAFFCPNEPAVREWRKKELTDALLKCPQIDIVDIGEVFYIGNKNSDGDYSAYSCICKRCADRFLVEYPDEKSMPDFENPKSAYFWKTNPSLYKKWIAFRTKSAVDYQNDLINGKGGLRDRCPKVKICTWSLGNSTPKPDPLSFMIETQASDGAAIVAACRPDSHCVQTNYPDWCQENLPSDYAKDYKLYLDAIKKVAPKLPISMQTEIGSLITMRRTKDWYKGYDKTAHEIGFTQTMGYMYCLFKDIAESKPVLIKARSTSEGKVVLVFNKRLDDATASNKDQYEIPGREIISVKADGNLVLLEAKGLRTGDTIIVNKCADDPSTRHFAKELIVQNTAGPYMIKIKR